VQIVPLPGRMDKYEKSLVMKRVKELTSRNVGSDLTQTGIAPDRTAFATFLKKQLVRIQVGIDTALEGPVV
jgi:hypothetical protein